jgi:hypothetical protein
MRRQDAWWAHGIDHLTVGRLLRFEGALIALCARHLVKNLTETQAGFRNFILKTFIFQIFRLLPFNQSSEVTDSKPVLEVA